MTLTIENRSVNGIVADLEIIIVENKKLTSDASLLQMSGFEGEDATCFLLAEKALLYVGVEKKDTNHLQITAAKVAKTLNGYNYSSAKLSCESLSSYELKAFSEGLLLGDYSFTKYKSKPKKIKFSSCTFAYEGSDFMLYENALFEAITISNATNFSRELVNTTPEDLYPLRLAEIASDLAKENDLNYDCLDESTFLENDMEAIYMVGRSSRHNSQLIHLNYKPKNPLAKISLVGKGLTYDSGGLSLKPADSMVTMKLDKAGACAVLGIMKAASELELPIEINGFIGAVENMIGGDAYKPDDVLRAKNGTTIEVRNTDAEGRLVLADVLCYAQEKTDSDYIFDYATLTGACVVALGMYTTGIMGHNSKLKHDIAKANDASGEFTSSLPFNDHLKDELKSEVADIKNVTGRWGGAITAGLFLDNFIEEKNRDKWVHFDIAGPAFTEKPWGVNGYGGTGAGVRLTIAFMQDLIRQKS
jgi:leucyl aminopeptidase